MAEFIDDMAARLVTQGVGALGTTILIGSRSTIPPLGGEEAIITLTDTGGSGPTRVQNQDAAATKRPTAQVLARAKKYSVAKAKLIQAYAALDGIFNTTVNGTFYLSVVARQEPTDIGLDDAARPMVAFNIEGERIPS